MRKYRCKRRFSFHVTPLTEENCLGNVSDDDENCEREATVSRIVFSHEHSRILVIENSKFSNDTSAFFRQSAEASAMGKRPGIPAVLHRHVGRPRQRLAVPVHSLRKRRRRLPDTVHYHPIRRRKTVLSTGDGARPILQSFSREDLELIARVQRCAPVSKHVFRDPD